MRSAEMAQELRERYGLTYKCSINLEGTITNMLLLMNEEDVKMILEDIFDNVEFLSENA